MALFDKTTQDSKIYTWMQMITPYGPKALSFDDLEMCRVLKSLERYYNIQIRYADPMVGHKELAETGFKQKSE